MDSYIRANLAPGEHIEHIAKPHWVVFLGAGMWAGFGLIISIAGGAFDGLFPVQVLAALAYAASLVQLVVRGIYYFSTELGATNKRVIGKTGLIARNTFEFDNYRVESVNLDQSIAGRLLGYGTLTIRGMGGTPVALAAINNPVAFRNARLEVLERIKQEN
ncbi:hypothetical protein LCGC14_0328140 [marine sediment metagenome]|uniref:YdbS-like PH domain-containing protein n=1 Tax=marine sediment metagenome TaxID=412755 RepID=A0A0F9TH87_9ZZZZ